MQLVRCDASNEDLAALVDKLDADLALRDGEDHDFYHQFNSISSIKYAMVGYINDVPVACGAIKEFDSDSVEVKRMYVLPDNRGRGLATEILSALENWASELGYGRCVLETGKKQPEAIKLYLKCGYRIISNYGQYEGIENSVCFEKKLNR